MPEMVCPACGGLLREPGAPCPRCGYGRPNLAENIGARSGWDAVFVAGITMLVGVLLLAGGPVIIWFWGLLGVEPTWGWLAALVCAAAGLAVLAWGARILLAYVVWRRKR